jgi:hypothetical protein
LAGLDGHEDRARCHSSRSDVNRDVAGIWEGTRAQKYLALVAILDHEWKPLLREDLPNFP